MTTTSYASNATANIYTLPDDVTTVDHSSIKVKEAKYYYDSQSFSNVNYGNLTEESDWISGSTYANTYKTYDSYGDVTQVMDPDSNATSYTMDIYHLYPSTVTNALSQATTYTYDYFTGNVISKTDPNSLVWDYTYDGIGRELTATEPDLATPTTQDTKETYSYTDTSGSVSNTKCEYLTSSSSVCTYTYYDGLNRPIQTKAASAAGYETMDTAYNNRGLVSETTLPYITSSSAKSSPTTTASLEVNYTYDPLGRNLTTVNNLGTTSNLYSGWTVTVTDPRSKTKVLYKDVYGNLVQVDEHNSGSTYSTYYTYNGLRKLTNITDALGNVRNFTYDGLGNNLSAQDLHPTSDTTYFKTLYYAYDSAGNLTQKIDGNGNTVNYIYDALNRELTENYTGTSGVEVTNTYDSCTDGAGYLCGITTAAYTLANTYNANGEIASETKTIGSTNYVTSYTYDRQGNQVTITNPDSSIIKYEYDTGGQVNKVSDKESGASSYTYIVNSTTYSPTNQPTVITYANGVTTTNTYDSTKLYRLTHKVTSNGTSNIQNMAYTYDANGNITEIVDSSANDASKTVNFIYDDLNRLAQATATGVASGQSTYIQNYAYNAIGDITSGPVGNYTYSGSSSGVYANPDAVTSIGTTSLSYDDNGNLLTKGTNLTNTWDYNNRLTQSVAGSTTVNYSYDANGQRLTYANGTTTTTYPSKFYNTDGTTPIKHVFMDGMDIASIMGTAGSAVIHTDSDDQIGGSSVTTSSSGTIEEVEDYYPFGEVRLDEQTSYNEQRKFSGSEYDADTGLNYMNARYYDSSDGRFASEDPAVISNPGSFIIDPQQMNFYSYARNNPLTITDPSGMCIEDACIVEGAIAAAIVYGPEIINYTTAALQTAYTGTLGYLTAKGYINNDQQALNNAGALVSMGMGGVSGPAEESPETIAMEPGGSINFSQRTVNPTMGNGMTIDDLAAAIKSGDTDPASLKVGVGNVEGNQLAANNRTAAALTKANIPQSQWVQEPLTNEQTSQLQSRLTRNGLGSAGSSSVIVTTNPQNYGVTGLTVVGRPASQNSIIGKK